MAQNMLKDLSKFSKFEQAYICGLMGVPYYRVDEFPWFDRDQVRAVLVDHAVDTRATLQNPALALLKKLEEKR